MIFTKTPLGDVTLVELQPLADERGFFARAWCEKEFRDAGLNPRVTQINFSYNEKRGTLRGVHWQESPFEEAKLVRCTRGSIFDVAVDVRPGSPTLGQWFGTELSASNRTMLYIPEGFAHGYQILEDETDVLYQTSSPYAPESERGARWDDSAFGIHWPITEGVILSEKDRSWPDFVA
jgi:dTDP-4-dehydrorhamnose 3,5-epimerase